MRTLTIWTLLGATTMSVVGCGSDGNGTSILDVHRDDPMRDDPADSGAPKEETESEEATRDAGSDMTRDPTEDDTMEPAGPVDASAGPTDEPSPAESASSAVIPGMLPIEPHDPAAELAPGELIEKAVFRIEAVGTYATPLSSENTGAVGGTGFVIDVAGYALTNAHVVSGATLLKVTFTGDEREHNARVVARAECSDLALLEVEGDDFVPMTWSEQDAALGTEVFAVGYPLGGELTLTSGIISKESTPAHTDWASVDDTIEHTATINPGNSGGPLLSADYEVIGVNFAGSDFNQYYAIGQRETQPILEQLMNGQDVYSIGLTGTAVAEGSLSGIWVFAVQAGSPADKAGVKPGDLITHFGGLPLLPSTDGAITMELYCDVLRSHSGTAAIDLRLIRWASGELWEGQINGRKVQVVEGGAVIEPEPDPVIDYVGIVNMEGSIAYRVPSSWSDRGAGASGDLDGSAGHTLAAAPNLDAFMGSWDAAGVVVSAWADTSLTPAEVLELVSVLGACDNSSQVESFEIGQYAALHVAGSGCSDTEAVVTEVVLQAPDHTVAIFHQGLSDADVDALVEVVASLLVDPTLLP